MGVNDKQMKKIEEAFSRAHAGKPAPEPGPGWSQNLMREIRQMEPAGSAIDFTDLFGQFVWRLAPVAAVLLVALSIGIYNFDFIPMDQVADIVLEEPMDRYFLAGL